MTASRHADAEVNVAKQVSVLAWSGVESVCRQLLSLLFFFGTMRFLTPTDLGVFSLAVALMGILSVVIDEPIGEALIQKLQVSESDWNTGYTINLLVAGLCLVLACGASAAAAGVLHRSLAFAVPALALSSVVGAAGNIHKAFLSRALRFRAIAQTTLAAQLFAGTLSLCAAAAGLGYWALILNVLAAATATTIIYRSIAPWRPKFRLDAATVQARAPYVGYAIAVRTVYLLRDQSLFIVAGSLGDLRTVGYLSLAMRVARTLGQLFEDVTCRPLLSLVSGRQNDVRAFGAILQQVLLMVGVFAFPGFLGLAEIGTPLISTLLGAGWAPAGQFLPWICAALGGWLFLHVVAVALRARGRAQVAVYLTAPAAVIDVVIFASAAVFGLDVALRLWALRAALMLPVLVAVLSAALGVPPRDLARIWTAPIASALLMIAALRWIEGQSVAHQGVVGLIVLLGAGVFVYGAALMILSPPATRQQLLLRVPGR